MQNKGQFTILVIFGLLALIVIGIVLFIASSVKEETTKQQAREAVSNFVQANSLRGYVESCLESVSEQAVNLAGWQGGNIWVYQNGTVDLGVEDVDYVATNYNADADFEIPYVIKTVDNAYCPEIETEPGLYPYAEPIPGISSYIAFATSLGLGNIPPGIQSTLATTAPHRSPEISELNGELFWNECPYYNNEGFFGVKSTNTLCTYEGPNWKGDVDRPSLYSTCEGKYGYEQEDPVQYQLRNYTQSQLLKCANFERLEQVEGFRVEVVNRPKINFTFGREDITVNALYPVRVSEEGLPPVEVQIDFTHRIDARFKELYEFFQDLVLKEIRNSSFDPSSDYDSSRFYRDGFRADFDNNCCSEAPGASMIRVFDDRSIVAGKTLTIQGLVENRAPVLGLVPSFSFTVEDRTTTDIILDLSDYLQDPDGNPSDAQFWGFLDSMMTTMWDEDTKTTGATIDMLGPGELAGCTEEVVDGEDTCVPPTTQNKYVFVEVSDAAGSDFQYEGIELLFNVACAETCPD